MRSFHISCRSIVSGFKLNFLNLFIILSLFSFASWFAMFTSSSFIFSSKLFICSLKQFGSHTMYSHIVQLDAEHFSCFVCKCVFNSLFLIPVKSHFLQYLRLFLFFKNAFLSLINFVILWLTGFSLFFLFILIFWKANLQWDLSVCLQSSICFSSGFYSQNNLKIGSYLMLFL